MLYEIMKHIRNFFPGDSESGFYTIKDGMLSLPFVKDGQYILIEGSKFNDGVFSYPLGELTDEEFRGTVTALNIPKDFLALASEIEEWTAKNKATGYVAESFGGYSYQKATTKSGTMASWKEVFASRLNTWRKL